VDVDTFAALLGAPGAAAATDALTLLDAGTDVVAVAALVRQRHPGLSAAVSSAAVTQATLRRRGRVKFGVAADQMWFTPDGLEQATRADVATHRARRFGSLTDRLGQPPRVVDLCCGIGGDLAALSAAGCDVTGIDRDQVTVLAAHANNPAARVECLGVESVDLAPYNAAFIDPARRAQGRRTFDVEAYEPAWPFVTELLARMPAAAAKLAPGIPHDLVPAGVEAEWVSSGGSLKEAVLWAGALRAGGVLRRATLLPSGATMTATTTSSTTVDEAPATGVMRRYIYEPDDAVVRAHLVGDLARSLDGVLPDATTAYITSDRLVSTPFAQAFEVDAVMPFSLKRLRAALRERDVGGVTIMKRGSAVDVEQLRRDLRLSGSRQAVVVLALVGGRRHAVIASSGRG
jgi:SAM-dependent methyltransferase